MQQTQSPAPDRNPDGTPFAHESQPGGPLVRNALLYSDTHDIPSLSPMEFSATGSESHRHGGAVAVDLGARYGNYAADKYLHRFPGESPGEEYLVYFNMSRHLPQNAALCKLFGVADSKRPGKRPMFRGDVVVVKAYTVNILEGLTATYPHRTYVDFPAVKMVFADDFMRRWFQSAAWADMTFKDEQECESGIYTCVQADARLRTQMSSRRAPYPLTGTGAIPPTSPDSITMPTTETNARRSPQCPSILT